MTTYTLSLGPSRWDLAQILNDERYTSITGAMQTQARTGNRWNLVLSYLNLTGTRRRTMEAYAMSLNGVVHRAQVNWSTLGYTRGGTGGGTSILAGTHTAGQRSCFIAGATINITNWLKANDYISIGNELKVVTAAVNSASDTTATIPFWPELHKNYPNNTPVDIVTPKGVFFLRAPITMSREPFGSDPLNAALMLDLEEDILA